MMFAEVFSAVWSAAIWVWNLFFTLADYFGFTGLLLSLFGLYTVIRFLLRPIFGSALSDLASNTKSIAKSGATIIKARVSSQRSSKE